MTDLGLFGGKTADVAGQAVGQAVQVGPGAQASGLFFIGEEAYFHQEGR